MLNLKSMREGFGEELVELGEENPDIVVLTADLGESTKAAGFGKKFPERFFNVGVAEQNLAGIAAGMASESFIPIMTSYAVFSPGRNWEQIRDSIGYSNLHVIIIGAHSGLSAGIYGSTHLGLEDIAIMRVIPNMTVIAPADYYQTKAALRAAIEWPGPVYIRLARQETLILGQTTDYRPLTTAQILADRFEIGKADILREGSDITIVACGTMVNLALQAAEKMTTDYRLLTTDDARQTTDAPIAAEEMTTDHRLLTTAAPISAEIINVHTIKPLDVKTLAQSAKKTGKVIIVEDHQITGGLGSAVGEILSDQCPVLIKRIGISDSFGESGKPEELYKKYGLTKENIVKTAREMVK